MSYYDVAEIVRGALESPATYDSLRKFIPADVLDEVEIALDAARRKVAARRWDSTLPTATDDEAEEFAACLTRAAAILREHGVHKDGKAGSRSWSGFTAKDNETGVKLTITDPGCSGGPKVAAPIEHPAWN